MRRFSVLPGTFLLLLGFVTAGYGQVSTSSLSGVVTDESGGVLPGVTVTATNEATSRESVGTTNQRGEYRLANLPPGMYTVRVELSGFAPMVFQQMELLVGQRATQSFSMTLASLEETITVTGESPMIETESSQVADYVDSRQMEELPLQGRNWMELAMLAKGVTANTAADAPGVGRDELFQLNVDGQQVTQKLGQARYGQAKFSREAIGEYQVVTQLFDITQGRSTGIQVQAITKSGTNDLRGSVFGYFRSDSLNASDPVAGEVLPYSNQQVGGSFGGPIIRDKMHFFGSFEYEREPATVFMQPPFLPGQSFTQEAKNINKIYLGKVDYQASDDDHLNFRVSRHDWSNPFDFVSGSTHPSQGQPREQSSTNILGTWSRLMGDDMTGTLRVGYNQFYFLNEVLDEVRGNPQYGFPGLSVGPRTNSPHGFYQKQYSARYDLQWYRGSHTLKIGGEFLHFQTDAYWDVVASGSMVFSENPPDLNRRFPQDAWNDPSRWDLTGLDDMALVFSQNFSESDFDIDIPRPQAALWLGDTWNVGERLTLNYGVRWDADWRLTSPPGITENVILIDNGVEARDFGYKGGNADLNNVAPRVGLTYDVSGKGDFVIRGGTGIFYSNPASNIAYIHQLYNQMVSAETLNDGQPGFVEDPWRGLTRDDFLAGEVDLPAQSPRILDPDYKLPYTWQTSVGFQKQFDRVTAIDADLLHWIWHNDGRSYEPNLFFDPETGYQVDPAFGRPNPEYATVVWTTSTGTRDYLALSTSLKRRLKDNFQGGMTYTYMFFMRDDGPGGTGPLSGPANNQFDYLDGEWARSLDFQRHTLRAYGLYQLPWGLSVSGMYLFGSGNYFYTSHASRPYGKTSLNRLNLGPPVTIPEDVRDRFNGPAVIETGTEVPRTALKGFPLHKVDVRLTKDFQLGLNARISLIGEVFNLFNHDNFGAYNGVVNSGTFGQPQASTANAYAPRTGQLAVRVEF